MADYPVDDHWAREVESAVRQWVATLPVDVVELRRRPVPAFDEYGLESILALTPSRVEACPLELGITGPAEGSRVYISIDTARELAARLGLECRGAGDGGRIALYREPMRLSLQQVLEVCRAVCHGEVVLTVGTVGNRLASTTGFIRLPDGDLPLHGIDQALPFLKLARLAGLAVFREVRYQPWFD